jgi:hypothetical protein
MSEASKDYLELQKRYLGLDPLGKDQHEKGAKLDLGKPPIFEGALQYFPRAIEAVAKLSLWGATRYTWEGWRSVPDGFKRYSNALGRHVLKEKTEGLYDLDARNDPKHPAEILHATQVAWNALARLDLLIEELEKK